MTRIGIVGSRGWKDERAVRALVRDLYVDFLDDLVIVSGGARGVDSWAADEARCLGVAVDEKLPDWKRYGKAAGFRRNEEIVVCSDEVYAFWDGVSRGTRHTIEVCESRDVPCRVVVPDQSVWRTPEALT